MAAKSTIPAKSAEGENGSMETRYRCKLKDAHKYLFCVRFMLIMGGPGEGLCDTKHRMYVVYQLLALYDHIVHGDGIVCGGFLDDVSTIGAEALKNLDLEKV